MADSESVPLIRGAAPSDGRNARVDGEDESGQTNRASTDGTDTSAVGTYCQSGLQGLLASRYVAFCAVLAAMGGLLFGYDQGVISIVLTEDQFLDRFDRIAPGQPAAGYWKGLLTAMIELGAVLGAFNQGWIADRYSRKYSIVMAVIVFAIGSALQTGALGYNMLLLARFIGGLGIGMLSMVAPLYISEISPPEIRGALLVLEELSIVSGIVVSYYITYATRTIQSEWAWRLPFLLQLLPGLFLAGGILHLPFSPRWLASKGRDRAALQSLAKLRQLPDKDPRVQNEWRQILTEAALHRDMQRHRHPHLQDESTSSRIKLEVQSWLDLFRQGCWRRSHIGVMIMFFQQFVGINALIYYGPTLFESMGLEYDAQLIMAGVLNIVQLVGVTSSIWTMDRFGRRPLLMTGSLFMAISHIVIAILVARYGDEWPTHRLQGWLGVTLLLLYMLAFGASWGPVAWAIPAEIFPSSLRAKGVAMSTCSNWLNNFFIGLVTPPMIDATGYGAYVFFAVFCGLSLVWTYLFLPETKGKSLEQMDEVFGDTSSKAEQARYSRIRHEVDGHD